MQLFPTKEVRFKLLDSEAETIARLKRRTEFSEKMTSGFTDKSFRGIVNDREFRLISSEIGKGAFCVMSGQIDNGHGYVRVEINGAFKILSGILCAALLVGFLLNVVKNPGDFLILLLVAIGQILMMRFFFLGLFFSRFSKRALSRLRDVLDIEFNTSSS